MPMKSMSGLAMAAASVSRGDEEAVGDQHVGVALQRRGDVGGVVGLGHRLDEAGVLDAEALVGGGHALEGELVERAVVDPADVGDEVDAEAVGSLQALVGRALVVERDERRAALAGRAGAFGWCRGRVGRRGGEAHRGGSGDGKHELALDHEVPLLGFGFTVTARGLDGVADCGVLAPPPRGAPGAFVRRQPLRTIQRR